MITKLYYIHWKWTAWPARAKNSLVIQWHITNTPDYTILYESKKYKHAKVHAFMGTLHKPRHTHKNGLVHPKENKNGQEQIMTLVLYSQLQDFLWTEHKLSV